MRLYALLLSGHQKLCYIANSAIGVLLFNQITLISILLLVTTNSQQQYNFFGLFHVCSLNHCRLNLLGTFETIFNGRKHRNERNVRRSKGIDFSTRIVMHLFYVYNDDEIFCSLDLCLKRLFSKRFCCHELM